MSKIKNDEITKINHLLISQNQALHQMRLFSDQDQNQSLCNRSHIAKNNNKYLQKINKAEEMVKQARNTSQEGQKRIKNGILRKNLRSKEPFNPQKYAESELSYDIKQKSKGKIELQSIPKNKIEIMNSSVMDRKVEEQISRIQDKRLKQNENSQHFLPKEILEGQINKSIVNIEHALVKNYFKEKINIINSTTSPEQIYKIMNPFYQLCGIKIALPLIKKYKNCAYFGNSTKSPDAIYEGFLILHQQQKLYYGELQNEKKNGKGTEIDFKNDIVYIGNFIKGKKVDVFIVIKPHEKYVGELLKGQYHGMGELTTQMSVYRGNFQNGERHGEGEQTFLQMGLTICGTFTNNKFNNKPQKIAENSHLNTISSKVQTPQKTQQTNSTTKSIYPQATSLKNQYKMDKNIVFQKSVFSRQNFQQYDCEFGEDEEDFEDQDIIKTQRVPAFRIKQAFRHQGQRKQRIGDKKSNLFSPNLKI